LEDSIANWHRLRAAYLRKLPDYMPRHGGRILPGVSDLLHDLTASGEFAVGLLTGNVRDGARIKLEFFDLFRFFAFGGFGDDHHDRDRVAGEALNAAHNHINGQADDARVWVIGDTPLDVACGRSIDANVLAVATGLLSREELETATPDVLLDDLSDTQAVIERLRA
jgi:phosphoglycolate phosphatase-like HAD superfamily hydrolase